MRVKGPAALQSDPSDVWLVRTDAALTGLREAQKDESRAAGEAAEGVKDAHNPSGPLSFFANMVFSRAARKSAIVTRILRSRSARRPASVQTALMSAPENSSLACTNSSRSTSSARFMRDVWILKMNRFVLRSGSLCEQKCEPSARETERRGENARELDLAVNATGTDERRVERLDLVGRHDDLDVAAVVKAVKLVEKLEHGALDLALAARRRVVSADAPRQPGRLAPRKRERRTASCRRHRSRR